MLNDVIAIVTVQRLVYTRQHEAPDMKATFRESFINKQETSSSVHTSFIASIGVIPSMSSTLRPGSYRMIIITSIALTLPL